MAVFLSPVGGAGAQFFDANGTPLSGGKLYTYSAGTTTPAVTYTSSAGNTPHSNPIILDAAGRVSGSGEIWLTNGESYKFVLKDSNDVLIGTWDNIFGNGDPTFTEYTPAASSLLAPGPLTVKAALDEITNDETGSSFIGYLLPQPNALKTTVFDKLQQYVSVLDFGADPTGANDSHDAFADAIQTGGTVYIPQGTYIINSAITITNPVKLIGDGTQKTFIHRNYSPGVSSANDAEGIFNIRNGGSGVVMQDMTLRSLAGQSGGCLVSLVNTTSSFGLFKFDHVDFTTTGSSTHQYTIYTDGTGATSAPIGIRGLDMVACSVFGGGISTLLIKGVLKFSFLGGGVYPAGGVAGSNVRFDGSVAVPTQSFTFLPSDCSCPISFDHAILGIFGCGVMGAVTNTANTENVYGFGFTGSLQQNWVNSMFFDTSTGLKMTLNQKITNKGSPTTFGLEMYGPITGFEKSGSVTKVGETGVSYSTLCPDTQTFGFANQSGKLFSISTGGGAAALVFADYKSTTITLLSNPSSEFQASAAPGVGFTGIFKSANSHQINVKNNTGSAITYDILNFGNVASTSDPV